LAQPSAAEIATFYFEVGEPHLHVGDIEFRSVHLPQKVRDVAGEFRDLTREVCDLPRNVWRYRW